MHRFIIRVVSLLSFIKSLLRSKKQEESSPKIRELFLTCKMKKFQDGGPPPRPSNTGETMTERPPVLDSARYARATEIGQR
jgi:hypothetical protein